MDLNIILVYIPANYLNTFPISSVGMSTASTAGTGAGRQAPRLNWKTPRTWATEVGISKTTNSGIIIPGQEVTGVRCALKESTAPLHMTIADQRGIIIITTPQHPIISTTIANKNQSINSSFFFYGIFTKFYSISLWTKHECLKQNTKEIQNFLLEWQTVGQSETLAI